jgi:hypothetical protein
MSFQVVDEISDQFRAAVTQPYALAVQVEARYRGLTTLTDLSVVTGTVTCTRLADTHRSLRCRLAGIPTGLLPHVGVRSPLDPFGNELTVAAGVRYYDATTELLPQGVFRIATSRIVDTAEGVAVDLTAVDRAGWISKCSLPTVWQTPAGTTATGAITALVSVFIPDVEVIDLSTRGAVDAFPSHVLAERANPWTAGVDVFAEAVGAEAFFDLHGRLILRDVPDPAGQAAAWQYVEGATCTMTELDTALDDSAPNVVVAAGETPDAAGFRAYAINSDPTSPTYYGPTVDDPVPGGYGPRTLSITSPLITSQGQAQAMADAQGLRLFAPTQQSVITAAPNPGVVEGDVLRVRRARDGIDIAVVVDSFPLSLTTSGSQRLTCTLASVTPS